MSLINPAIRLVTKLNNFIRLVKPSTNSVIIKVNGTDIIPNAAEAEVRSY